MIRPAFTLAFLAVLALSLMTPAPAQAQDYGAAYDAREINDPIEPVNRAIFGFNDVLDRFLIEPVAKGYKAVVPPVARTAVQSFMRNLRAPLIIANNLLQGEIGDAGVATARFLINTTAGIGGLVDVASTHGLEYEYEDFGQTLGKWGFGHGFYLVLPVLGPSSLRDGIGIRVDTYVDPVRIIAENSDKDWIYYAREGLEGLDHRSRMIEAIRDMRTNSLDYYAAARSAYGQKRASLIRDEKPGAAAAALDSNDYPQ